MTELLKIAENVDVMPVVMALAIRPDLWDENPIRTSHEGTAHADVSDILVWFNDLESSDILNDIQTFPFPAWFALIPLRSIVLDLMRRVSGTQLGRVVVTKIPPGKGVKPHADGGIPSTFYSRYQIVLQSGPGALFRVNDRTVTFKSGEIWWFDNTVDHEVINNSADDRLVCIVDIRT